MLKAGLVDVLGCLSTHEFHITDVNDDEVRYPRQPLDLAISKGWVKVTPVTTMQGLVVLANLLAVADEGEAAAIALAWSMNAGLALHDNGAKRVVAPYVPEERICNLGDIILEAVRAECIGPIEAQAAAERLAAQGEYRVDFLQTGIETALADPGRGILKTRRL